MDSSAEVETSSSAFLAQVMPVSPVSLARTPSLRSLQDKLVAEMDADFFNDFFNKFTESIQKFIQVYQDTKAKIEVIKDGLDYAYDYAEHTALEQFEEAEEERNAMLLEEDVERVMRRGRGETTDSESEADFEGEEPARAYPKYIHQQPDPFYEYNRMHEELEILEKKAERQEHFMKIYLAEERLRTMADL